MGYIFDPDVLHGIVKSSVGQPLDLMIKNIKDELSARYPGHILENDRWIFNNAGGAMGQMLVLHASITEYVIIFGSPIGTEGHSGRFYAEDFFFILEGEQWAYSESSPTREVYKPGDLHVLPKGMAQGYRMPDRCFALEYARGFIPAMLPFGLADTLFGTLDWRTLGKTLSVYGKSTIAELLQGKI
jgi:C-8 sterol isomerase